MPSLWLMTLILLAFFFAYYVYEPPYRGLYPDLLPQSEYGRAQGVQHLLRGCRDRRRPDRRRASLRRLAPGAVPDHRVRHGRGVRRRDLLRPRAAGRDEPRLRRRARLRRRTAGASCGREPEVRRFLVCNSAWEGTFAGARFFVVLYITQGLGESVGDQHGGARDRRRRLRGRGSVGGLGRRPLRARARHLLLLVRLRRRACSSPASRSSGTTGTSR